MSARIPGARPDIKQPVSRSDELKPSSRQIVFNWIMGESDFAAKKDGYWGGAEGVARVGALLSVLDAAAPDRF